MFRTLKCDLEKTMIYSGFLISVVLTYVLCFTASAYIDSVNEKSYTVFEVVFRNGRTEAFAHHPELTDIEIFLKAFQGYLTMFMPVVSSFPFVFSFHTQKNNSVIRFEIMRVGTKKYYFCKLASALISGGVAVMLGVGMFGLICFAIFPHQSVFDMGVQVSTAEMALRILATAFVYGVVSAIPSVFLCSFCNDPYVVICVPLMLFYVRDTAVSRLVDSAVERGEYELAAKYRSFSSSAIATLVYTTEINDNIKNILVINGALVTVLILASCAVIKSYKDKGA